MNITKIKPLLALPLKFIPLGLLKPFIKPCLKLIEEQLDDDDWDIIEGKWIEIKIEDINYSIFISASHKQLICSPSHLLLSQTPLTSDARVSGDTRSFLKLLDQQVDPESLFFQRQLKLSGDTELGYWFKAVLDRVEKENLPSILKTLSQWNNQLSQKPQLIR